MPDNLDEGQIEWVLQHRVLGHLGCFSDATCYVVPICYAYDGQCIYGRTYEGLKIQMMRKNPNVCFQVEHIENMARWQSVICWGDFEELKDRDQRDKAISVLKNRIEAVVDSDALRRSAQWPFSIDDSKEVKGILFCIHIHKKTGKRSVYDESMV